MSNYNPNTYSATNFSFNVTATKERSLKYKQASRIRQQWEKLYTPGQRAPFGSQIVEVSKSGICDMETKREIRRDYLFPLLSNKRSQGWVYLE